MIVVDASVLIKCMLPEKGSEQARTLVAERSCAAPELIVSECVNALWKNVRLSRVTAFEARQAETILGELGLELVRMTPLTVRALDLSLKLDHPAYDCFYLALAETRGSDLVTADGAFLRKVADARVTPIRIRHLWETAP
jgi:predicted nucleic acid-binding protein